MRHFLTQAELQDAIAYWLNNVKLKDPITVDKVEPENKKEIGINYVLHVWVTEKINQPKETP